MLCECVFVGGWVDCLMINFFDSVGVKVLFKFFIVIEGCCEVCSFVFC